MDALDVTKMNKMLTGNGIHGIKAVNVSWEDGMRSMDSCWGPNISDVGLLYKLDDSTSKAVGIKVRTDNMNEALAEVDARTFKVVISDPHGTNPRTDTLDNVLKEAGKHFLHTGLADDANLYSKDVDGGRIKLRIECIFAP